MLSQLFKPAWEHKDPERRITAISSFSEDNSEQQQVLENIAQSDPELKVRAEATARLINIPTLQTLSTSEVADQAKARLNQLISSKEDSHQKLVADFVPKADSETLTKILCISPDSKTRDLAIQKIEEQEVFAHIAAESEFADTRETAAKSVQQLDLLEPLWKKVRERDKNLAKDLHERIEQLKAVEIRRNQVADQAQQIIDSMAELKDSAWTPQYNLRFLALVNQWQQIESEVETEQGDQYRQLAIGVEATVIEHRSLLEEMEKQEQLVADAEQLQKDAQQLQLPELPLQLERWAMLRRIWLDSLSVTAPDESLGQRLDQVSAYFIALERIVNNQSAFAEIELDQEPLANREPLANKEPSAEEPSANEEQEQEQGQEPELAAQSEPVESEEIAEDKIVEEEVAEVETAEDKAIEQPEEKSAEQEAEVSEQPEQQPQEQQPEEQTEQQQKELDEVKADSASAILPTPKLAEQVESMRAAIKHINWPKDQEAPVALIDIKAALKKLETALKEQAAEQRQQLESFGKQIGRLNGAVKRGDLRMARGVFNKLETRFKRFSSEQQSKIQEQWDKAEKAYKEMLDWKEFAIQPKFIELCEQMEALADKEQSPQQRAEEIKKLQQAWKKLEALAADDVWQRFQTAGDKAFELCAAFYAELDVVRAKNLEQRKLVVEKLRSLAELPEKEEWQESPDWKSLRTKLREIRDEWRKYAEVDQQKCRKLGKKYADLTKKLEKHIKAESQANLARKQQLVDRAKTMSEMEGARISLDQLKELQASWKHIGITERRDDQKLWKKFQEACDAVFAKHREKIDASRAEEKQQADLAKKVIQSIRALAKTEEGAAPDEAQLKALQDEYHELPRLHDSVQKNLDRDMRKAVESVESSVTKYKRDKASQHFVEMQRRAELCATLESLDPDKDADKAEKLLAKWEEQTLPSEAAQLMEQRKEAAMAKKFGKAETDEAERARRLICIELEAVFGKETPAEDQALKMQYQLEQMKSKGLGANTSQDIGTTIEAARKSWYGSPAAAKKVQKELDERFHQLIASANGK